MVGYKAVDDYVKSGMVVGLGTGSTAYFAVERLGQLLESGELKDIVAIPTSVRTKEQAESLNIPLVTLDTHSKLDVAIDGADEVDPDLNLVKGGGGALLREKMVEVMADKFIVIVDESKLCDGLGPGFPLPVEITPFCHEHTLRTIAALPSCAGSDAVLRMGSSSSNVPDGDEIAVTDNGNYIVDLHFKEAIKDAPKMATELKNTVGVVDHGLFCDMTTAVIIAGSDGISVKEAAETALSQDELKKMVGYKAVDDYVKSGMVVGLGTGSTAYFAVERLGQLLESGELKDIVAIPTSVRTKEQAESLNIPLVTLDTHSKLDVAIDGADEVDPDLNLVKGGGGALLREKMVEVMADKFIVIVDESKLCDGLGPGFPLPVEITPFCHEHTLRTIAALPSCAGSDAVLRMGSSSSNVPDGDEIAVTDNGNYIVDLHFKEAIKDAPKMATELKNTVGVVDHGLFCDMTTAVIIAGSDGISVKEA